jgi:hypothetical protein
VFRRRAGQASSSFRGNATFVDAASMTLRLTGQAAEFAADPPAVLQSQATEIAHPDYETCHRALRAAVT